MNGKQSRTNGWAMNENASVVDRKLKEDIKMNRYIYLEDDNLIFKRKQDTDEQFVQGAGEFMYSNGYCDEDID